MCPTSHFPPPTDGEVDVASGSVDGASTPENPEAMTYQEFVLGPYTTYCQNTKRSLPDQLRIIRRHVFPQIGDLPIGKVTRADILGIVDHIHRAGYKPGTTNKILAIIKSTFSAAIDLGKCNREANPAARIKQIPNPNRIDTFLTPEQAHALYEAVSQSGNPLLKHIIAFLLATGARKREALNAEWQHIDWDKRTWTIPRSKSGKPRFVPLSDDAIAALKAAKETVDALADKVFSSTNYVFPNITTGKPFVTIFVSWDKARRRAGLPHFRIHDLRHSFASALINEGMTLYDVKELLGHANLATTTRYAHLSNARLVEIANVAGRHFGLSTDKTIV